MAHEHPSLALGVHGIHRRFVRQPRRPGAVPRCRNALISGLRMSCVRIVRFLRGDDRSTTDDKQDQSVSRNQFPVQIQCITPPRRNKGLGTRRDGERTRREGACGEREGSLLE